MHFKDSELIVQIAYLYIFYIYKISVFISKYFLLYFLYIYDSIDSETEEKIASWLKKKGIRKEKHMSALEGKYIGFKTGLLQTIQ